MANSLDCKKLEKLFKDCFVSKNEAMVLIDRLSKLKVARSLSGLPVIDYRDVEHLQGNLKELHDSNALKLLRSLSRFNFFIPFFIWNNNGKYFYVDGHGRDKVLSRFDIQPYELPYVEIEASTEKEAKEKLLVISSQYGTVTEEGMAEFTMDMDEDFLSDMVNFDLIDFELEEEAFEGKIDKDDIPDTEKNEYNVKKGDVWQLGDHRLMCGDSSIINDVKKLMNTEKCDIVFTDPPYGVSIGTKNKLLNSYQNSKAITEDIANDTLSPDDLKALLVQVFKNLKEVSKDQCSYFVTAPQGGDLGLMMMLMMNESGLPVRHIIIWVKNRQTFSLGRLDYEYKHEPILYTWNKKHKYYGKGSQRSSVWNFDRPNKNDLHPTMKPVELIENALLNNSKPGDLCVDLFIGSGSTIIANQVRGRVCNGMEIDPHYCSVTIKRWEEFTGLKAKKIKA